MRFANSRLCRQSAVKGGIIKSLLRKSWEVIPPQSSITQYIRFNDPLRKSNAPSFASLSLVPPSFILDSLRLLSLLSFFAFSFSLYLSPLFSHSFASAAAACSSFSSFSSLSWGGRCLSLKTGNHHHQHLYRHLARGRSPPVIHSVSHGDNYHQICETRDGSATREWKNRLKNRNWRKK